MKGISFIFVLVNTILENVLSCSPHQNPQSANIWNLTVRWVEDLESINSKNGVPVEYWYNETSFASESSRSSAPGCPQSNDGMPWIYFGTPPRCFLSGQQGPCALGSVLVAQNDSFNGVCGCLCLTDPDFNANDKHDVEKYITCTNIPSHYPPVSISGQIYDKKAQHCFNLFDQGPCNSTSVIAGVQNGELICLPHCRKMGFNSTTTVYDARNKKRCVLPPDQRDTGIVSVIASSCSRTQRFSTILRKCVNKFPAIGGIG